MDYFDKFTGAAVHAYTPYSFTYHSGESFETFIWDGHENSRIDGVFNDINGCLVRGVFPLLLRNTEP